MTDYSFSINRISKPFAFARWTFLVTGLLLLPAFWNTLAADRKDDEIKGLFTVVQNDTIESIVNINWGNNLPHYTGSRCDDKVHTIKISRYVPATDSYQEIHHIRYGDNPKNGSAPRYRG